MRSFIEYWQQLGKEQKVNEDKMRNELKGIINFGCTVNAETTLIYVIME